MAKSKQRKRFKHPSKEEQPTDLSSLDKLTEELGFVKVEPPKSIMVIFPSERE